MEPKFQTSFIPKKQNNTVVGGISVPPAQRQQRPHGVSVGSGIFKAIGIFVFILSLAGVAGAYGWKYYLSNQNVRLKSDLATREKQFNLELITKLKEVNAQIDSARTVLENHVAISQIFEILQQVTVSEIQLVSMDYTDGSSGSSVSVKGYGKNLAAVAFQSDVLNRLSDYKLPSVLKNPIVSEPILEESGQVSFSVTASIDKSSVSYKKSVMGGSAQ